MAGNIRVNEKEYREISKIVRRFSGMQTRQFFTRVGAKLVNDFRMGFRKSLSPENKRWAPVQRQGKPLIDTGRLRSSITFAASEGRLEVGTNVKYGPTQHFGDNSIVAQSVREHTRKIEQAFGRPIPSREVSVRAHTRNVQRNIKARPFLGIHLRQIAKITQVYRGYILELTNNKAVIS